MEEDIVAGGDVAFLRAIETPLCEIVCNAGEEASVVVAAVLAGKGNYG